MISLLTPTRNRPDNVRRMMGSAMATATGPLQFVFYVDDDAPESFPDRIPFPSGVQAFRYTTYVVDGPRIILSEMWNRCYEAATYDILMHCGDDIVFETPGWDKIVLDAFAEYPDHIALVHGTDSDTNFGTFGTHGFIHRRWVETVGYFVPPYFSSDWNDAWLNDVANRINRRRYVPIMTRHHHPVAGLAEWDQTHRDRLQRHAIDDCDSIYHSKVYERINDAAKLKAVMS